MLEPSKQPADKTEVHAQKAIEKQYKLLGQLRAQPGQIVWQMDLANNYEVTEAEIKLVVKFDKSIKKDLVIKKGFLYAVAINKKNAYKKFAKQMVAFKKRQLAEDTGK